MHDADVIGRGYELERRSVALGGGWRVRFFEDGVEAGGGVFPSGPSREASAAAYRDALEAGEEWIG